MYLYMVLWEAVLITNFKAAVTVVCLQAKISYLIIVDIFYLQQTIMWKTVQTKLSQKITIFLQFFSFITKKSKFQSNKKNASSFIPNSVRVIIKRLPTVRFYFRYSKKLSWPILLWEREGGRPRWASLLTGVWKLNVKLYWEDIQLHFLLHRCVRIRINGFLC